MCLPLFSGAFVHPLAASQAQVVSSWPANCLLPVALSGKCTALSSRGCRSKPCAETERALRLQMLGHPGAQSCRYIADGVSPVVTEPEAEQSLVAHYPDESKYKQYLKPRGHVGGPLWMPFWEPEELEALRAKHFAEKVSSAEVGHPVCSQKSTPLC